ncbi:hypothetical protein Pelo_6629 [Pelomyxa schiedti]|nr:hypothetical protein Pelo_6629 [Pelomyxa schiedti]
MSAQYTSRPRSRRPLADNLRLQTPTFSSSPSSVGSNVASAATATATAIATASTTTKPSTSSSGGSTVYLPRDNGDDRRGAPTSKQHGAASSATTAPPVSCSEGGARIPESFLISLEHEVVPIPPFIVRYYIKPDIIGQEVPLSRDEIDNVFNSLIHLDPQNLDLSKYQQKKIQVISDHPILPIIAQRATLISSQATMISSQATMISSQATKIAEGKKHTDPIHLSDVRLADENGATMQYFKTGEAMLADQSGQQALHHFVESIQTLKAKFWKNYHTEDMPFVILDGSSGMGKTQMAFSLNSDVIYIVWSLLKTQPIYKCWMPLSTSFLECMWRDVGKWIQIKGTRWPFCAFLGASGMRFWTVAWLNLLQKFQQTECLSSPSPDESQFPKRLPYSLLGREFDSIPGPMTIEEFHKAWPDTEGATNKPIVFIDEIPTKKMVKELIFIRNLCRVLGFVVVLSGTNSRAINFAQGFWDNTSRYESPPYLWCYLFSHSSLPSPPSLEVCWVPDRVQILARCNALHCKFGQFVEYCAQHSRALFVINMFDKLRELLPRCEGHLTLYRSSVPSRQEPLSILNALFVELHSLLLDEKPAVYEDTIGQAAQLALYFPGHKAPITQFVSHHFAHLWIPGGEAAYWKVYSDCGTLCYHPKHPKHDPLKKVTHGCCFPSLVQEPLLFLSLCGNMAVSSPFLKGKKDHQVPLIEAWPSIYQFATSIVDTSKPQTEHSRSHEFIFEQFGGVAVSAASHSGGFGGQTLSNFMHSLFFHLYGNSNNPCPCNQLPSEVTDNSNLCCRLWQNICNTVDEDILAQRIPFFPAQNDPITEELGCLKTIPGVFMEDLTLSKNKGVIDLRGGNIIVECKNWTSPVTSNNLQKVILKFLRQKNWTLGLILCRKTPVRLRSLPTKSYENLALFSVRKLDKYHPENSRTSPYHCDYPDWVCISRSSPLPFISLSTTRRTSLKGPLSNKLRSNNMKKKKMTQKLVKLRP